MEAAASLAAPQRKRRAGGGQAAVADRTLTAHYGTGGAQKLPVARGVGARSTGPLGSPFDGDGIGRSCPAQFLDRIATIIYLWGSYPAVG
jgi:hypothetical protein